MQLCDLALIILYHTHECSKNGYKVFGIGVVVTAAAVMVNDDLEAPTAMSVGP